MEKEIEQLIRTAMYEKLAAGTAHAMEPIVQAATPAIVEWLRKGVVWEEAGICHAEGSDEYTRTYHLETVTGKLTIYQFADGLSPGKSYRVTVRREARGGEGD